MFDTLRRIGLTVRAPGVDAARRPRRATRARVVVLVPIEHRRQRLLFSRFAMVVATWLSLGLASCDNSLEAKCNHGDGIACGVLGDRLRHGPDAAANVARSCDFYRKACAGENDASCANLGALLAQRRCVGSRGEALRVLDHSCNHGDTGGCNNLGMLLREGSEDIPSDSLRAEAAFRKACPRAATACDNLGSLLFERDRAGASGAFVAGCESTADKDTSAVATCCYKAGLSYENGWALDVDKKRASSLYTLSCSRRVGEGCYRLGLLETAESKDLPLAVSHFRQGCELGSAGACNNLGLMYANGMGVAPDPAKAIDYLQRGCDGGELRACANVGSRYVDGVGVAADAARGRELMAKACAGGVAEACKPPTSRPHPL